MLGPQIPFDTLNFARWAALAAMTPFMQLHGRANIAPWTVPDHVDETVALYRYWATLHHELVPFFHSSPSSANPSFTRLASRRTGRATTASRSAALLGRAPARRRAEPRREAAGRLALARLLDLASGWLEGGTTLKSYDASSRDKLPIFVRQGAIVPLEVASAVTGIGTAAHADRTTLLVFPGPAPTSFVLHDRTDRPRRSPPRRQPHAVAGGAPGDRAPPSRRGASERVRPGREDEPRRAGRSLERLFLRRQGPRALARAAPEQGLAGGHMVRRVLVQLGALLGLVLAVHGCRRAHAESTGAPSARRPQLRCPRLGEPTRRGRGRCGRRGDGEEPKRPGPFNVVVICIDSLRADMPWAGYRRNVRANLSRFEKRAVSFTRAYSIAPVTARSIPPLLVGKYPSEMPRTGHFFTTYYPQNLFLGERLQPLGHRSVAVFAHAYFYGEASNRASPTTTCCPAR